MRCLPLLLCFLRAIIQEKNAVVNTKMQKISDRRQKNGQLRRRERKQRQRSAVNTRRDHQHAAQPCGKAGPLQMPCQRKAAGHCQRVQNKVERQAVQREAGQECVIRAQKKQRRAQKSRQQTAPAFRPSASSFVSTNAAARNGQYSSFRCSQTLSLTGANTAVSGFGHRS